MFSYPFLDLHRSVRRITYAAARYLICIGDKRLYGLLKSKDLRCRAGRMTTFKHGHMCAIES